MTRKLPAYTVYLVIQGSFWLFFTMMATISAIYRVQSAGLNPLQLVLVGTVIEATVFLFEIPTGIVADLYSRRWSVIIGYLLIGLGFILEGTIPLFGTILLAQVIWGIGATFTSGAEEAWLADELGEERLTQTYLRGSQIAQLGAFVGIIISVALGSIALNLPMIIGGMLVVALAIFLILFMPETGFERKPDDERDTWQKAAGTFRNGLQTVRGRPVLGLMLAIAAIYGLSSEGLDRLWEAHFLANFTFPTVGGLQPIIWFGIINLVQMLLVILATELVRRKIQVDDQETALRTLQITSILMVVSLIVFGLAGSFAVAVAAVWGVFVFRRTSQPLYASWLNKGLRPDVRATVLSMRGQIDAIGQFVGGPIIGVVATTFSLRAAMVGVGLMLAPTIWLYGRALRLVRARETAGHTPGDQEEPEA
jgi:DHA3 family tetracycline resistance protein-like MFS transporter